MSANLLETTDIQQLKQVHHGKELATQLNHLILFRVLNPDSLEDGQTWIIGETSGGEDINLKQLEGHLLSDDFKLKAFVGQPWRIVKVELYEGGNSLYDSIQIVWCDRLF